MARKSSIDRMAPEVRSHIEKRLRENRLTLDELIDDLQTHFPSEELPSRSALGRKRKAVEEMGKSLREIDAAASALVAELGDDFQDKSGALLAQAVTTLTANLAFRELESSPKDLDIGDVLKLARAARAAQETRTLSLKERAQIEKMAREKLIAEQEEKLEEMRGTDGMSEQLENRIRKILLGKE